MKILSQSTIKELIFLHPGYISSTGDLTDYNIDDEKTQISTIQPFSIESILFGFILLFLFGILSYYLIKYFRFENVDFEK